MQPTMSSGEDLAHLALNKARSFQNKNIKGPVIRGHKALQKKNTFVYPSSPTTEAGVSKKNSETDLGGTQIFVKQATAIFPNFPEDSQAMSAFANTQMTSMESRENNELL